MIRNLLATTAIATLITTGAVAQTTQPTDPAATDQQPVEMTIRAEGHLASNIIDEAVYSSTGEDAQNIGSVRDLVLDQEGKIEAIVVGVGGFLGIGQKEVALQYDLIQWEEQPDGERRLVVETTEDALRAQPEFDRAAYRPMPADADVAETKPATKEDLAAAPPPDEGAQDTAGTDDTAMAPADEQTGDTAATAPTDEQAGETTAATPADEQAGDDQTATAEDRQDRPAEDTAAMTEERLADETDPTQTGAVDRSQLQNAQPDQIRAENLTGTTVYGANEENVGEIGDVVLTPEGEVDAIIVDVGGFLGIGQKEVAIGMDNLAFMTDENGDLYLYTDFTQQELEAQPEYNESTYAEQRDEMRLLNQ
ncbi:PRC-barrel domain-containing protein [Chelativorans salis]|uniref:PRC-barrel domain-containing protein n=1 Tax=Chelativorans salis TaxID=2978478 RepID=A0ABT2LS37_9HYPH|nr:PRC-barrel domain-containing protein [Chelativorans sp. EGI FJ00035]MCT7377350.1 PRC-barrel domain-containing protein [Chelativorans sp. EGI FJ00035]